MSSDLTTILQAIASTRPKPEPGMSIIPGVSMDEVRASMAEDARAEAKAEARAVAKANAQAKVAILSLIKGWTADKVMSLLFDIGEQEGILIAGVFLPDDLGVAKADMPSLQEAWDDFRCEGNSGLMEEIQQVVEMKEEDKCEECGKKGGEDVERLYNHVTGAEWICEDCNKPYKEAKEAETESETESETD